MPGEVEIEGIEKLERVLAGDNLYARPIQDELKIIARDGERVAREGAGLIANSILGEPSGYEARVRSTHPAAGHIEYGRRAGARMPPPDALTAWAQSRGIGVAGFVLARSIARRGIRGRFFLRAARRHIENRWREYAKEIGAQIGRRWAA